jgi:5'-nucleotidase
MPTILVTNDDGINAPGLLALKQAMATIADVLVVAPDRNWSASSHAKTMHTPLRIHQVTLPDGSTGYATTGSPTDCVALVMGDVFHIKPDLVVSGVNAGHNVGIDITYSGTVACAMEAVIKGVPGIAVSTCFPSETSWDIDLVRRMTAEMAREVALRVLESGLPEQTLLNLNVPGRAPADLRGVRNTRMGGRRYDPHEVLERQDPYGQPYYWLGGSRPEDDDDIDTDVGAVKHGYVSVTPITLDMTHHAFLGQLRDWRLPEFTGHGL